MIPTLDGWGGKAAKWYKSRVIRWYKGSGIDWREETNLYIGRMIKGLSNTKAGLYECRWYKVTGAHGEENPKIT